MEVKVVEDQPEVWNENEKDKGHAVQLCQVTREGEQGWGLAHESWM